MKLKDRRGTCGSGHCSHVRQPSALKRDPEGAQQNLASGAEEMRYKTIENGTSPLNFIVHEDRRKKK